MIGLTVAASLLLLGTAASVQEPEATPEQESKIEIQIRAEIEYVRTRTDQEIIEDIKENDPLIDCLIKHESRYNCDQTGAAGEKGCLQFMPVTYKAYCVKKYGLPDDIEDLANQVDCARMMIADNGISHWTTRVFCTRYENESTSYKDKTKSGSCRFYRGTEKTTIQDCGSEIWNCETTRLTTLLPGNWFETNQTKKE